MAPLTVALCVAVALQPVLAASVQKEDRVPKTSVGKQKTTQATALGKEEWKRTSDPEETAEDMILGQRHLGWFKRDVISGDDVDQIRRVLQKWLEYLRSLIIAEGTVRGNQVERRSIISREDEDDILSALDQLEEYLEMQRHRETATNLMVGNPASPLQETDWDDILEEKRGSPGQQQEANLAPPPTKAEDVCQDLQRLGPGPGQRVLLPFPLIQRHFLRLDENQDGFLDKTELSKFTETIEALKTCMTRAA